jgi:hypothetical protein
LGTEINDTVCGGSILVPFGPPASGIVNEGFVGREAGKEVIVVKAGSEVISTAGVRIGLLEIDGD